MPVRVYLSRSFHNIDRPVHEAIRRVLGHRDLEDLDIEVFDSAPKTGKQLAGKITDDVARADAVVCVFSRRHQIARASRDPSRARKAASSAKFSSPSYVSSEAAYALALGKRLILFLEKGVEPDEMGLVEALNLEHIPFRRRDIETLSFHEAARDLIRAQLQDQLLAPRPAHVFRRYELIHSVYPNGYTLNHLRLVVEVQDVPSELRHTMFVVSPERLRAGHKLPNSRNLVTAGRKHLMPYPNDPFVAFAASSDAITMAPVKSSGTERAFEIRFSSPGTYRYQWMWGARDLFDPKRRLSSFRIRSAFRAVRRVDVSLRVHRQITGRVVPGLARIPADELPEPVSDASLEPYYPRIARAGPDQTEHAPLFTGYHFAVEPVPAASDLLLIY